MDLGHIQSFHSSTSTHDRWAAGGIHKAERMSFYALVSYRSDVDSNEDRILEQSLLFMEAYDRMH